MAEGTPKKRRRRKEARPQEIVEAAMEAFAEQGFAGTRIEDIAERSGVAKGTVYLYFETKDALFEAGVREHLSPMFGRLTKFVKEFPGPTSDLVKLILERIYEQLINNESRRAVMKILIAEGNRFPQLTAFYHQEIVTGGKQLWRTVLKRGVDQGEFDKSAIMQAPEVIMGPAVMAAVWKMVFDNISPIDLDKHRKAHIDLVLNGLMKR